MSDQTPNIPAGWYPDPEAPRGQRYWDGQQWTEHRQAPAPVPAASSITAPSSGTSTSWLLPLGLLVLGLVVGGAIGWSIGSSSDDMPMRYMSDDPPPAGSKPSTEPTDGQPDTLAVATFTLKGEGNTRAVELPGGDYSVRWRTGGDCYYSVDLEKTRGRPFDTHSLFAADGRTSGEQQLYDIGAGTYYAAAITGPAPGCPWSVTMRQVGLVSGP